MCISAGMAMAISTGLSVIGQIKQGQTQQAQQQSQQQALAQEKAAQASEYDIQAAESRNQAAEFQLQAAQEKVSAEQTAKRIRAAGEKTAGAARASMAGSGIVVDSGSGVNINEDIYKGSESDAFNTLLTGENNAASYMRNADTSMARSSSFNRSANMARAAGRAAGRDMGRDSIDSSLLGSLTTVASSFAGWKGGKGAVPSSKDVIIPMQPGGGY